MILNKKYLILIFLFTSIILTIGIVSAADNTTNTTTNSIVSENTVASTTPTYTTLYDEIKNTPENEELILTKDYTYYKNYDDKTFPYENYIPINKTLTINGNGHTINGNNIASSFNIAYDTNNVILKNIIFKNCYNTNQGHRILDTCANTIIQNCTFINCHGSERASGIINLQGNNNTIQDCRFQNCYNTISYKPTLSSESLNGGIIYVSGWNNTILNCNFHNCYNNYTYYGSTSYTIKGNVIHTTMDHNTIEKCTFKNTQIYKTSSVNVNKYGDIYMDSWESNITDCTFDTSYTTSNGVFIYLNAANINITQCSFKNSESASVYVKGKDCRLSDSEFINCKNYATRWIGSNGIMTGCTFTDCDFNENINDWRGDNGQYITPNNDSSETGNNTAEPVNNNSSNIIQNNTQDNSQSETGTVKTTNTNTKVVKKVTPKIIAKKKTFKTKTRIKKYTVKLQVNSKPLKKATLTLKIKGKTYKVKTNNKGIATFKIKNLNKKGKYSGIILFKSTKEYNSKKVKTIITIKK